MYRFELHIPACERHPNGAVRTVRMVELSRDTNLYERMFSHIMDDRISAVDEYYQLLLMDVLPMYECAVDVYLVYGSKANTNA